MSEHVGQLEFVTAVLHVSWQLRPPSVERHRAEHLVGFLLRHDVTARRDSRVAAPTDSIPSISPSQPSSSARWRRSMRSVSMSSRRCSIMGSWSSGQQHPYGERPQPQVTRRGLRVSTSSRPRRTPLPVLQYTFRSLVQSTVLTASGLRAWTAFPNSSTRCSHDTTTAGHTGNRDDAWVLTLVRDFTHPAEKVWPWLTEADRPRQWSPVIPDRAFHSVRWRLAPTDRLPAGTSASACSTAHWGAAASGRVVDQDAERHGWESLRAEAEVLGV